MGTYEVEVCRRFYVTRTIRVTAENEMMAEEEASRLMGLRNYEREDMEFECEDILSCQEVNA